jgi:toxin ParE1/3/4
MTVRFTPRARDDLAAILQYLDERSPQGAQSVKRTLRKTVELVGQFPHSGGAAGIEGTRVLPVGRYPYLIYWSVEDGDAWVVHIRHAKREPWSEGEGS